MCDSEQFRTAQLSNIVRNSKKKDIKCGKKIILLFFFIYYIKDIIKMKYIIIIINLQTTEQNFKSAGGAT